MVGWLMGEALVTAIKEAGVACPTRKALITNMRLVDDYTANGWFDPIDYRQEFNRAFPCAYYVQVVNKAFVPDNQGQAYCAKQVIKDNKVNKALSNLSVPPTTPTTAPAG